MVLYGLQASNLTGQFKYLMQGDMGNMDAATYTIVIIQNYYYA